MNHPLNDDERAVLVKMLNEHGYRQVLEAMADHAKLCGDAVLAAHGHCRTAQRWSETEWAVRDWSESRVITHCSVPTWDVVTA